MGFETFPFLTPCFKVIQYNKAVPMGFETFPFSCLYSSGFIIKQSLWDLKLK